MKLSEYQRSHTDYYVYQLTIAGKPAYIGYGRGTRLRSSARNFECKYGLNPGIIVLRKDLDLGTARGLERDLLYALKDMNLVNKRKGATLKIKSEVRLKTGQSRETRTKTARQRAALQSWSDPKIRAARCEAMRRAHRK